MPNPVAEVVERLRARASCQREDGWEISREGDPTLLENAADLIERLSRERDTGVPAGFVLVPKEPTREMLKAGAWAQHSQACDGGHNIVGCEAAEVCWPAMLSAAPQPPTVSDYEDRQKFEQHLWRVIDDGNPPSVPSDLVDAVARIKSYANRVTRERDQLKADLERAYKVDDQKTREINILTGENRKVYRERDQAREALAKELDAAKADLNSSFFCVFLDGRNEHGSHVVEMPGSNITPDDAMDLVAVLNDQDLGFAEQIIKDAESLGHEVGHCVVTIWDLTHDPEWGVECEYRRISTVLTNLMVGTPEEQRASSVLHPEKEEKA